MEPFYHVSTPLPAQIGLRLPPPVNGGKDRERTPTGVDFPGTTGTTPITVTTAVN